MSGRAPGGAGRLRRRAGATWRWAGATWRWAGGLLLLATVGVLAAPVLAREAIAFRTDDGVLLRGHAFGTGWGVVILSHMYGTEQRIWFDLAEAAARRGLTALTYDYRGIGRSAGRFVIAQTWRDAVAAVDLVRRRGADRPVVLVGASMGGTVSLRAAAERPVQGIVVVASGMRFRGLDVRPHLAGLRAPKLFIAGSRDEPFATSVRTMYARTPPPKTLRLYPTAAHGIHLFGTRHGPAVRGEILAFVVRHALVR